MAASANSNNLPNLHPLLLRLDRNNYAFWRIQVLTTIRAHSLENFISSTATSPSPLLPSSSTITRSIPNPDYNQWMRKDQFLMSWLLSSISESMMGYVVRCTNACEVWNTLEQLFQSQSRARALQLKNQLLSQKKGSLTVDEYFLKMRGLADQLSAVGSGISDAELSERILSGFRAEYEAVVVNLLHRADPPNLQELQYALQSHEARLQQQFSFSITDPMAHYAQRGRGSSRGRGMIGRGSLFKNRKSSVVCQLCSRPGHAALKCYKRFDIHFTGPDSSIATSANPQAYVTDVQSSQEYDYDEDEGWYVDSGATNHITNSMQNLQVNSPYAGNEALTVGNGQEFSSNSASGQAAQGALQDGSVSAMSQA